MDIHAHVFFGESMKMQSFEKNTFPCMTTFFFVGNRGGEMGRVRASSPHFFGVGRFGVRGSLLPLTPNGVACPCQKNVYVGVFFLLD